MENLEFVHAVLTVVLFHIREPRMQRFNVCSSSTVGVIIMRFGKL